MTVKIFVDIDNTICITQNSDYHNSTPIIERIKKINSLFDDGYHITYWTARGNNSGIDWTKFTHTQLQQWGCLYHELILGKPSFDVFIDDKAFNSEDYFK